MVALIQDLGEMERVIYLMKNSKYGNINHDLTEYNLAALFGSSEM